MTSYSSLTSRCTFVSRQHSTESDFEFPSMTKALMNSCLFIVCKSMFTIGESQRRKQQRWMETTATSSGAERTSLNEFQMLKFFKSKWKRFWIISLINIWANIAVTKHVLLADEFVPYRVNAMKCIYVGFSMSKLQSFLWKISLNSFLIRLEGFNNKISTTLPECSTWPSGKAFARCPEGPEFKSAQDFILIASFLFFPSSFSFQFRYNSFVMFLYKAHNFWLTNVLLGFTCRSPEVLREVLRFTYLQSC